jgi:putative cell wall-binding protein
MGKYHNKFFISLTIILLVFSTYIGSRVSAATSGNGSTYSSNSTDTTPPVVSGVSVDKTEAHPGDEVTVSIDATDDMSGVSYVSVSYKNSSSYQTIYQDAVYNEATKKYEAKILIDNTTKPGPWIQNSIYVSDNANNYQTIQNYFSGSSYTVINQNADVTPPVVNGVTIDKQEAQPGDDVVVSVDASDDQGVSSVSVSYNSSNGGYMSSQATYNASTKRYDAKFPIADDTKPGTWSISSIDVSDNSDNYSTYSNMNGEFIGTDFIVVNPNADITAPLITSMSVDKKVASAGDEVTISMDVSDDKSGVAGVSLNLSNNNSSQMLDAVYNDVTKKYEVKIPITNQTSAGKWSINSVGAYDNASNWKDYSSKFRSVSFTVDKGTTSDSTPPNFKSVKVDKTQAGPNEEVTASIDASDDQSGIDTITVNYSYKSDNNYYAEPFMYADAVLNDTTGLYEAKFPISNDTKPGNVEISSIVLTDKDGNMQEIDSGSADLSGGNFTINNPNVDGAPPVFNNVSVDKTEAAPGDQVTISIDAQDNQSGIQDVSLTLRKPNNMFQYETAVFNPTSNKYEVKIPIKDFDTSGIWKIESINMADNSGNYTSIYNKDFYGTMGSNAIDLSNGQFKVVNANTDTTAPAINSIKVNQSTFAPGDTAVVELDANDSQSGIASINVNYTDANGDSYSDKAMYNTATKKYVLKIPVVDSTRPGDWHVSSIDAIDKAGNEAVYPSEVYDFTGGNFTVVNAQLDSTPPSLNGVSVDKTKAQPGDEVTVSLDVTDDTAVSFVSVEYRNGTNNFFTQSNTINETAEYNAQTKKYEVKIPITNATQTGNWKIDSVSVWDSSGNGKTIVNGADADLSSGDFAVSNNADTIAPEFKGISVDKTEVKPGDKVTYSIDANDNQSGIKSVYFMIGSGDNFDPNNFGGQNFEAKYNAQTQKYEASLPIDAGFTSGTYKVIYVAIVDNCNNVTYLENGKDADLSSADIHVVNDTNTNADITPPSVNSISVDKKVTLPGDVVTVSLNVTDTQSGISYVGVEYQDINGNLFDQTAVYNDQTGNYEVKIPVTALMKPGAWSIQSVNVGDTANNYNSIMNDGTNILTNGDFSISNNALDSTPPAKPVVLDVTDQSKTVTGTAEAMSTIIVKSGNQELGRSNADINGNYSVPIEVQKAGTVLTVIAVDSSGNQSEGTNTSVLDKTAPAAPSINDVSTKSLFVTGTAEPGATVSVAIGTEKYNGQADGSGNYSVSIPVQQAGTSISVTAMDAAGNVSDTATATVTNSNSIVTRTFGATRYDTAVEIAKKGWTTADTVVIATGTDFPDALAGAPLAYKLNAPILLANNGSLSDSTKQEISSLKATKAVILGGTSAVSSSVEDQLKALGINNIQRLAGQNRFETASLIAEKLGGNTATAIVAYGYNYPDALSVASYAAQAGIPILLTNTDSIPAETSKELAGKTETIVVGGEAAVSNSVYNALPGHKRIGGADRFETSANIVKQLSMSASNVYVATGRNFADALTGSVLAAKENAPMLLVEQNSIPASISDLMGLKGTKNVNILGGLDAISSSVQSQLSN